MKTKLNVTYLTREDEEIRKHVKGFVETDTWTTHRLKDFSDERYNELSEAGYAPAIDIDGVLYPVRADETLVLLGEHPLIIKTDKWRDILNDSSYPDE